MANGQSRVSLKHIPLEYAEIDGKKWFVIGVGEKIQCAYCLYMQDLRIVRDDTGLVTHQEVTRESHNLTCPQKAV